MLRRALVLQLALYRHRQVRHAAAEEHQQVVQRDDAGQERMVKALTIRIGISIGLFALLFVMWWLGWIEPHGLDR